MTGFDFNQSEQHILSIRLSADGFSFSIHHPHTGELCLYTPYPVDASCSMTANLKEMIATTEAFRHTYKRINILIDTTRFTPIPFDLFEDEQQENIFYQNFSSKDNEIVLCNILGKSNSVILFGMDKHTRSVLEEYFPHGRIYASISPLTEYFTQESRTGSCRKLYAHLQKDTIEVFGFDKGKLLFINTFSCKQVADLVYYLLYIWQHLGFHQENDHLYLVGEKEQQKKVEMELCKFLRQVHIIENPNFEIPFDIQTLLTCE